MAIILNKVFKNSYCWKRKYTGNKINDMISSYIDNLVALFILEDGFLIKLIKEIKR